MARRRRRWTASSLAKQYRECLDAGDRTCAREAAERIKRSDSKTARAVVASARSHGLVGTRGRRGLRGTPAQHESMAADYVRTAQHLLHVSRTTDGPRSANALARAHDAALAAQAECVWLRSATPNPTCAIVYNTLDEILSAGPRRLSGTKKRRLGAVVVRRGKSYAQIEPSTRRAASNPFRDELAPGQHGDSKCSIKVGASSFAPTKAGFRAAREKAKSSGSEITMKCGHRSTRMVRVEQGELVFERGVAAAKKTLKYT